MRGVYIGLLILAVFFFLTPCLIHASDVSLERDLQRNLEQSRIVIDLVREKLRAGLPVGEEWTRLRTLSEGIKASHLLLEERFKLRGDEIKVD